MTTVCVDVLDGGHQDTCHECGADGVCCGHCVRVEVVQP
jgi:hypothetical protein